MLRARKFRATPALLLAGIISALVPIVSKSREGRPSNASPHEHAQPLESDELSGKVIRVLDGDTIEILRVEAAGKHPVRIRMTGIDAPEKSQPFGEKCRDHLASLIAGKDVRVDFRGTDRYSRSLGVIFAAQVDVNLAQISSGCAWHYKQYQKQQKAEERRSYSEAEERARSAHLGLWRDANPQAPWEYRRETRGTRRKGRLR